MECLWRRGDRCKTYAEHVTLVCGLWSFETVGLCSITVRWLKQRSAEHVRLSADVVWFRAGFLFNFLSFTRKLKRYGFIVDRATPPRAAIKQTHSSLLLILQVDTLCTIHIKGIRCRCTFNCSQRECSLFSVSNHSTKGTYEIVCHLAPDLVWTDNIQRRTVVLCACLLSDFSSPSARGKWILRVLFFFFFFSQHNGWTKICHAT